MKGVNMMFLGGLMMAIGVENSGLHRRVALSVLKVIHKGPFLNDVHITWECVDTLNLSAN